MIRRWGIVAGLACVGLVGAAGLWGGMVLGGWDVWSPHFARLHGPLVVLGFLGTLIGLERALTIRSPWVWAWPAGTVLGAAVLLAGLPPWVGGAVFSLTGLVQLAVVAAVCRDHLPSHVTLMAAAFAAWMMAASGLILNLPVSAVVPAMASYLVFTVVAVRVELIGTPASTASKVISRMLLFAAVAAALAGSIAAPWYPRLGASVVGIAMVTIALWLGVSDLPRRVMRLGGLGRQMSITFIAGYLWLAAAGVGWAAGLLTPGRSTYGPAIHAVFLGFVMSMMMAHAPVVVPLMARRHIASWPGLTVPLAVLHASLGIRIVGDLTGIGPISRWGGVGTALALGLIGAQAIIALARSRAVAPIPEIYIP